MSRRYMLQLPPTSYASQANAAVLSAAQGQQLQLYAAHLTNRSGAAQDMGFLVRLAQVSAAMKFLTYTSPGPAVDATSAMLAGTSQNIFTTTNNDGFVVQSPRAFNLIGFTLTQGQSGGPAYTYKYFNGTSFVALPDMLNTPSYVAGDNVIAFSTPLDWVAGTTVGVGGFSSLYTVLVQATTASGQAVQANALWMGRFLAFEPSVANNNLLSLLYDDQYPVTLNALEGLMPYFQTASAKNLVTAKYFDV